ncbi:MAG TPA: hypothetical protein VLW45_12425 [Pelomicrobium sp.]|nr:hypothetical protein [Pelomicrobium sp.]
MAGNKKKAEPRSGPLIAAAVTATMTGVAQAAEPAQVASNDEVAQLWAQASGAAPPAVVQADDGGTRIEWRGGVSYDGYRNTASGGFVNTPMRDGTFNTVQLQSDLRVIEPTNDVNWFQFGMTGSDDRAVLSNSTLINTLQFGRTGEGYRVAAGDVPVNFSVIGANFGLRGLLGERYFGRTLVQGGAGVISQSWEALGKKNRRLQYTRNAYTGKVQHPLTESLGVYLTMQGYSDSEGSVNPGVTALAPAEGRTTTGGFTYQQGQVTVTGEAGISNWKEQGFQDEDDSAYIVDAAWQGEQLGVRIGHHDIGEYYTSLSGLAMPGVRETYANANWFAASWVSFNGDVRRTRNERAQPTAVAGVPVPFTAISVETDSWTVGANVAVPQLQGLSLLASHSQADGENSNGGTNESRNSGAAVQYASDGWSAGVSYQRGEIENSATPFYNGNTDTWSYSLGKFWSDTVAGTWSFGGNVIYGDQRQQLDSGLETKNRNWTVTLTGQHVRWGQINASWYTGRVRDPLTGQEYDQDQYQIDAGRALNERASVKLYYRDTTSFQGNAAIAYEEKQVGLQLIIVQQ